MAAVGDKPRHIGHALRLVRVAHDVRAQEVVRATGIAQPTLSRIENGTLSVTHDRALKILEAIVNSSSARGGA